MRSKKINNFNNNDFELFPKLWEGGVKDNRKSQDKNKKKKIEKALRTKINKVKSK
jgi:hypothetical protein